MNIMVVPFCHPTAAPLMQVHGILGAALGKQCIRLIIIIDAFVFSALYLSIG